MEVSPAVASQSSRVAARCGDIIAHALTISHLDRYQIQGDFPE
jgi:hypothetical protein